MPFPAAFLQMYFPGDWRSEAASEGRKNFLLPVRRAALRCCSSGIVSPRLRGGNFGASVVFFVAGRGDGMLQHRRLSVSGWE